MGRATLADGTITEARLEELRATSGEVSELPQFNQYAGLDAIRHFALGRGDDNPLFCDPAYAAGTRWQNVIAPATFVFSCGFPRSRGLPGVHGLFSGIDLVCHRPIPAGARIRALSSLYALDERQGRYAGRQFQQTARTDYVYEQGDLFSTLYSHAFRMERAKAARSDKYGALERKTYSDDDLAPIEQAYDREVDTRRGAKRRAPDQVAVGDVLAPMVKGPLTVTDNIAFLVGFGTVFVRAHRQWHDFRKRHPGAGVRDQYGVWDVPERVHWDEKLAASIGMPGPYDYGPQRIAWFDHYITDWMGDDAWLRRLSVELRAPNFVGDTTWLTGRVTDRADDGTIRIEIDATDQRGRVTATGYALVELAGRD